MKIGLRAVLIGLIATTAIAGPAQARVSDVAATRSAADTVTVSWKGARAVDLYLADKADAPIADARLVSSNDRDGSQAVTVEGPTRPYFLVRDRADGAVAEVAERLLPLEQGSNFRDLGGYPGADGKHVRWGLIYRSGATPMLTQGDLAEVRALGLRNMLDLRSAEERQLAPTRIEGVPYSAIGYRMAEMMPASGPLRNGVALYHNLPGFLAPQLRLLFADLLRNEGPIVYNCSAGQDRTGFATAMILSALGVPREVIVKDYLLSTQYRRPAFEMPRIDASLYPDNAAAQMFAHFQDAPGGAVAQPLVEDDGTPFLAGAFDEIDGKWGSVQGYLRKEIGLTDEQIADLRSTYLGEYRAVR